MAYEIALQYRFNAMSHSRVRHLQVQYLIERDDSLLATRVRSC